MTVLTVVLLLVVLATAVATGARHWQVPAPSLLVIVGLGVGFLPWVPDVHVPPEVISVGVLPPLLYASAEELSVRELRAVWRPVTVLAFGLVVASAAAVGWVASVFLSLPPSMAFVLGAVLASTDPVAVTALGRRLSLPGRVQTMVQAESLFNDATSLVLFKVAVAGAVVAGGVSASDAAGRFVLLGGGGALVGGAIGWMVTLIRRRTQDPTLETVIALVTPYAAYVVAEDLHTSGVTAVVVSAIVLGSTGHRVSSAPIRLRVHAVYETVVFLLESVVFALIGLQLPALVRSIRGGEVGDWALGVPALAFTVLAVRLLWVFPMSALTGFGRNGARASAYGAEAGTAVAGEQTEYRTAGGPRAGTEASVSVTGGFAPRNGGEATGGAGAMNGRGPRSDRAGGRSGVSSGTAGDRAVSWRMAAVLSWAGTRGVMPLAAALSIPVTTRAGGPLQDRPLVLVLTTGVVIVTLVVQGFTLPGVVRRSGIALEPEHTAREEARARRAVTAAALAELDLLAELEAAPKVVVEQLRQRLRARLAEHDEKTVDGRSGETPVDEGSAEDYRVLRRALIAVETAELRRLYERNEVSGTTRRSLERALDLEEAGLGS